MLAKGKARNTETEKNCLSRYNIILRFYAKLNIKAQWTLTNRVNRMIILIVTIVISEHVTTKNAHKKK